jgi:hypothetical protein
LVQYNYFRCLVLPLVMPLVQEQPLAGHRLLASSILI